MWSWAAASQGLRGLPGGQEEPQAGEGVPVPSPPAWGVLLHTPNVAASPSFHPSRGSPCLQASSVLSKSSWSTTRASPRWAPAKMNSAPVAASARESEIWPLVAEGFGDESAWIEERRSVCDNRVSLFQVKEPNLKQDTKLTLGWKTSLSLLRGCPPTPEPNPANIWCISI